MQLTPPPHTHPPHEEYESKNYRPEYYKGKDKMEGAIGIRKRQKGGPSVIHFASKKHLEKDLRALADKCMKKLDKGGDVDDVKAWCSEQLR